MYCLRQFSRRCKKAPSPWKWWNFHAQKRENHITNNNRVFLRGLHHCVPSSILFTSVFSELHRSPLTVKMMGFPCTKRENHLTNTNRVTFIFQSVERVKSHNFICHAVNRRTAPFRHSQCKMASFLNVEIRTSFVLIQITQLLVT